MSKFKKSICLLCALAFALGCVSMTARADYGISPYMTYIKSASCMIDVSGATPVASAWVMGYSTASKCQVTVELQVKTLFWWSSVGSDTQTSYSSYCSANYSAPLTSGRTYRAVATVTVWEGDLSETQTITSSEKVAP